jgi:hypothetical protein
MSWVVRLADEAGKFIDGLPQKARRQVSDSISQMEEDPSRASFGGRQKSRLAAEFRIFGDWDTTRVLTFVPSGAGAGVALPGGSPMDVASAAEFVLGPVLFPA